MPRPTARTRPAILDTINAGQDADVALLKFGEGRTSLHLIVEQSRIDRPATRPPRRQGIADQFGADAPDRGSAFHGHGHVRDSYFLVVWLAMYAAVNAPLYGATGGVRSSVVRGLCGLTHLLASMSAPGHRVPS